jgi:hypothetical protein
MIYAQPTPAAIYFISIWERHSQQYRQCMYNVKDFAVETKQ